MVSNSHSLLGIGMISENHGTHYERTDGGRLQDIADAQRTDSGHLEDTADTQRTHSGHLQHTADSQRTVRGQTAES